MRLRLYFEELGRITAPVPPIDEQNAVVDYIENAIDQRLGELVSRINQSVSTLGEFRSALITDAITGQIDVETWSRRGNTDRRMDAIEEEMQA